MKRGSWFLWCRRIRFRTGSRDQTSVACSGPSPACKAVSCSAARVRLVSGVENAPGTGGLPLYGSVKFGKLICGVCQVRRCADRRLQRARPGRCNTARRKCHKRMSAATSAITKHVPGNADARRKRRSCRWNQARGDARIARIEQSRGALGMHGRLPPRNKQRLQVIDLCVRQRQLVAQAKIQA